MASLLITRPTMLAASLIERCRALGHTVFHEPLLTIEPRGGLRPALPQKPIILITSRVTCEVMASRKAELGDLLTAQTYCVGERTAEAARAFGFTEIKRFAQDSGELVPVFLKQEPPGKTILHIGGEDRETFFSETVRGAGFKIIPWVVYRAVGAPRLSDPLIAALRNKSIDGTLFMSPRTAKVFVSLIKASGLEPCCRALIAVGLSPAVSSALQELPFDKLLTAACPTEADIVECVTKTFSPS